MTPFSIPGAVSGHVRGNPIATTAGVVTPVARETRFSWPGGGFTWLRPSAVEVELDGTVHRIPIANVTRRSIMGIVAAELAVVALALGARRVFATRKR